MKLGSLCSGAGGLDLAVEQVFGAETVWHCETDRAASKVLATRWPGVPNHGDLTQIHNWHGLESVDILCAGWPCQPFSLAGKRKGADDHRAIWPHIAECVRVLRPRIIALENVTAVFGPEFSRVADSLAALGYDLWWTCLRASDVGAPHRRERLFVLAHAKGDGWDEGWIESARLIRGSDAAVSSDGPLLPAPAVNDIGDGKTVESWDEWAAKSKAKHGNGNGHGNSLAIEAQRMGGAGPVKLLPTPSSADGDGGHLNRSGSRSDELLLPGIARAHGNFELLPTPNAQDGNGGSRYSSEGHQSTLPGEVRLLPTTKASDGQRQDCPSERERNTPSLVSVDHYLPIPAASDATGGGSHPDSRIGHTSQTIDVVLGTEQWGKYAAAIQRWESLTRPAPAPTEPNRNNKPRLNPAFSEWMMGWPAGWVTDIDISRNDQLRIIGNGVVVAQAIAAFEFLLRLEVAA